MIPDITTMIFIIKYENFLLKYIIFFIFYYSVVIKVSALVNHKGYSMILESSSYS